MQRLSDETGGVVGPILCAPQIRQVDEKLLELLRSLTPEEWELPTVAPLWKVRDVAAHLLDTALRKLALVRDGYPLDTGKIASPQDLVALVDRLNREGVAVYRRLGPSLLIQIMELACEQSADFHEALDPFAPAVFSVSWAGEDSSFNWFDTARELTERWHHQQQIRLATGQPGIMTPDLYHPVLDCFLRGLPFAYRALDAPTVLVAVSGECGGQWYLVRATARWELCRRAANAPAARVEIPQELAWRIFTKGIDRNAARAQIAVAGDPSLAEPALHLTAIVG